MSYASSVLRSYGGAHRAAGDASSLVGLIANGSPSGTPGAVLTAGQGRVIIQGVPGNVYQHTELYDASRHTVPIYNMGSADEGSLAYAALPTGTYAFSTMREGEAPVTGDVVVTAGRDRRYRLNPTGITFLSDVPAATGLPATLVMQSAAPPVAPSQTVPAFVLPASQGRVIVTGIPDGFSQRAALAASGASIPLMRNGADMFANVPAGNYTLSTWREEDTGSSATGGVIGHQVIMSRVGEHSFPVTVLAERNVTYAYSPSVTTGEGRDTRTTMASLVRVGDAPANGNQQTTDVQIMPPRDTAGSPNTMLLVGGVLIGVAGLALYLGAGE